MNGAERVTFVVLLLPLLLATNGCGAPLTDDELFEQARDVNTTFKETVSAVQLEILDGDWEVVTYGDAPEACNPGGYRYDLIRYTPEGWRMDGTPVELAERVAAGLDDSGWMDIKTRGYSQEIADVVVEARYPERHIELLVVNISPGEAYDSVALYATSTCQPGDSHEVFDLVYADGGSSGPSAEYLPEVEHPRAEPSFGFTEDGKRRFPDTSN